MNKTVNPKQFSALLREAMARKGFTQEALAEEIKLRTGKRPGQTTISSWKRGAKSPSILLLPAILDALDLTWEDLSGTEQNGLPAPGNKESLEKRTDVVLLPHLARASAGDGYINDSEELQIVRYDPYPRDELQRITGSIPDVFGTITVVGNSMEPEIRANDTVVFRPTNQLSDYGLYVFSIDDQTMIKLLQRYIGGVIEVIPLNPIYKRETLVPVEGDTPNLYRSQETGVTGVLRIIGKVVCYIKPA